MRGKSVYLAGPISGLNYAGAVEWRHLAVSLFRQQGGSDIEVYSPMRAKEYLRDEKNIGQDYSHLHTMSSHSGIVTRDRFDCMRADAILMNLLGADRVSIGTMIEAGWADAARVPICLVMEPKGNCHDHGMLTNIAGWRTDSVEEAVFIISRFLLP